MKRFLDLADFGRLELEALLALARRLEEQPEPQALAGKILGLVFFNPSLRTLASMQAGMARLGEARLWSRQGKARGNLSSGTVSR